MVRFSCVLPLWKAIELTITPVLTVLKNIENWPFYSQIRKTGHFFWDTLYIKFLWNRAHFYNYISIPYHKFFWFVKLACHIHTLLIFDSICGYYIEGYELAPGKKWIPPLHTTSKPMFSSPCGGRISQLKS